MAENTSTVLWPSPSTGHVDSPLWLNTVTVAENIPPLCSIVAENIPPLCSIVAENIPPLWSLVAENISTVLWFSPGTCQKNTPGHVDSILRLNTVAKAENIPPLWRIFPKTVYFQSRILQDSLRKRGGPQYNTYSLSSIRSLLSTPAQPSP